MNDTPRSDVDAKRGTIPEPKQGSATPTTSPHEPNSIGRRTPIRSERRPALTELQHGWRDSIAAPMRRARDATLLLEAQLRRGELALEPRTIRYRAALRRRPGSDTRELGSRSEISIGLRRRQLSDGAFD